MTLKYQEIRKARSFLYSWKVIAILALITLFFIHSTWVVYQKKLESERGVRSATEKALVLEKQEADLKQNTDNLRTEAGVEAEIRSKFSLAKSDEGVVVVFEDKDATSTTSIVQYGFWHKIRLWLGF